MRRFAILSLLGVLLAGPSVHAEVTALVFSRDGKLLFTAALNRPLQVIDAATRKPLRSILPQQTTYGLALTPNGKTLAAAGSRGVLLFDLTPGAKDEPRRLDGLADSALSATLSPDGRTLACGAQDGTVRLWDLAASKAKAVLKGHEGKVTAVAFSGDGTLLASGGVASADLPAIRGLTQSDHVLVWDVAKAERKQRLALRGQRVLFTPDSRHVIGSGPYVEFPPTPGGGISLQGGTRAAIWELEKNRQLHAFTEQGNTVAVSADGRLMATGRGSYLHAGGVIISRGSAGVGLHIWETASGGEVKRVPVKENEAAALAFSPDGRWIVSGRKDGQIDWHELTPAGWTARKELPAIAKEQAWERLAGTDAKAAHEAVWTLAAVSDGVAFLKARLGPAAPAGPKVGLLIKDLDSKQFRKREAAFKELAGLGSQTDADLREALKNRPSAEVRRSVELLLEQIAGQAASPQRLREERALAVLERTASPEAKALVNSLASGAPSAALTRAALAVLARLP